VRRRPDGRGRRGMSGPAVFRLTRIGKPIASLPLGDGEQMGDESKAPFVNELQEVGFQVDDRDPDTEYRLWIGDRDPVRSDEGGIMRVKGVARGTAVCWDDASYFDGARGRVWVRLASRRAGSDDAWDTRVQMPVWVEATKLSEARYNTM